MWEVHPAHQKVIHVRHTPCTYIHGKVSCLRRGAFHANPYVGRSMRTEGELVHNENAYVK